MPPDAAVAMMRAGSTSPWTEFCTFIGYPLLIFAAIAGVIIAGAYLHEYVTAHRTRWR